MPPEADPFAYTYFLDESISGKTLVSAMREAGYSVKVLSEEFGSGTPDPEWLPVAAEKQWVLIGKDDRWRYRSEEKEILIRAKARAFIFVSKTAKREEIAGAIIGALPKMAVLLANQAPPFIGRILLSGYVGLIILETRLLLRNDPIQSTMNSLAPSSVDERCGSALSAT